MCPQMLIISEPTLLTQALDRQLYPEFIDKPDFYSGIDQVQDSLCILQHALNLQKNNAGLYADSNMH